MTKKAFILTLAGTCLLAINSHASTIIETSTLNGSFEFDDSTGTSSPDNDGFNAWTIGGNVAELQRIENNASHGTWSALIGAAKDTGSKLGVIQNTGYVVSSGETFDFSFDWANAFLWDSNDTVNWRLFTTDDNTLSGTVTLIASGSETDDVASNLSYQTESYTGTGSVVAANLGQQLWVEIYSATAQLNGIDNLEGEFARLDNVQLTSIPEPSTYALLGGFLALVSIMVRRRS